MAIISRNENSSLGQYGSTQIRYAAVYVFITFAVLLFLNIYTSRTSQELFYKNKETAMLERCQLTASDVSSLPVLNAGTVMTITDQLSSVKYTRLIVTDDACSVIYDSAGENARWVFYPEILQALEGMDVFTWNYRDGTMRSCAATPVYSYGSLIGCVYMTEFDSQQGTLIYSLQRNIFSTTFILETLVILFSVIFAHVYIRRIRRLRQSMRIIRGGDYDHKVTMGGRDELTMLGNEFNELTARLQISESKRRQFVSDASHELKTPLASIKLLSDSVLQNQMDMNTVREFVGDIGNEAERLNRLSQKLLSLSRVDSLAQEDCEIIYMQPTISRVEKMLSGIAAESAIQVHIRIVTDCPILIVEDDLYQIIFNLMENGIKYNTPGGDLRLTLDRKDDNAVLMVEDTGVGISKDAQEHIFERFYRVDKARSRKTGGSGLGLSIVRDLVQRHNGEIFVESEPGQGTKFTVTFPVFDIEEDTQ